MIFLTDEERKKFSAYLKQDAESDKEMGEQFKKLNDMMGIGAGLEEALSNKFETEMKAKLIVASILDKTETVGGG